MKPIEAMARAAYADWIESVQDLEPAWSDLPASHQDRLMNAMLAALRALRENLSEGMCDAAYTAITNSKSAEDVLEAALRAAEENGE